MKEVEDQILQYQTKMNRSVLHSAWLSFSFEVSLKCQQRLGAEHSKRWLKNILFFEMLLDNFSIKSVNHLH